MEYLKKIYECAMTSCAYIEGYELDEIKKLIGYKKLPKSYVEFLITMGKRIDFFDGESYQINELNGIREDANHIISEKNKLFFLGKNDFVFWTSQACIFAFFRLDEGDDPPIYVFFEDQKRKSYIKVAESFSDFLLKKCHHDRELFSNIEAE